MGYKCRDWINQRAAQIVSSPRIIKQFLSCYYLILYAAALVAAQQECCAISYSSPLYIMADDDKILPCAPPASTARADTTKV